MRLLRRYAPRNDELVVRIVYRVSRKIIKRNKIFKEFFCLFIFVLNSILLARYSILVLLCKTYQFSGGLSLIRVRAVTGVMITYSFLPFLVFKVTVPPIVGVPFLLKPTLLSVKFTSCIIIFSN